MIRRSSDRDSSAPAAGRDRRGQVSVDDFLHGRRSALRCCATTWSSPNVPGERSRSAGIDPRKLSSKPPPGQPEVRSGPPPGRAEPPERRAAEATPGLAPGVQPADAVEQHRIASPGPMGAAGVEHPPTLQLGSRAGRIHRPRSYSAFRRGRRTKTVQVKQVGGFVADIDAASAANRRAQRRPATFLMPRRAEKPPVCSCTSTVGRRPPRARAH